MGRDIEYVRFCAKREADVVYNGLDELMNDIRNLRLGIEHTEKYKALSEALIALSIISRYGIEVFENNTDEHKEWWE
jgi:pyruvate/oxaloacetate carboxyltransferase